MKFGLVLVCVVTILTSACNLGSKNPVVGSVESKVSVTTYLGEWDLIEVGGKPNRAHFHLSIRKGADESLSVTYSDASKTVQERALLARMGKATIASVSEHGKLWTIMRVDLEDNGNQMTLKTIPDQKLKADIQSGVVAGSVNRVEEDVLQITASEEQLRAYMEKRVDQFSDTFAVFRRAAANNS